MAKIIKTAKLPSQIWRPGPYIYFYDGKCGGINEEYVKYINYLAAKYKDLNVLQIDWDDKLKFQPRTQPCELNKIYLFNNGIEIECLSLPQKEEIFKLFENAIKLYNLHVERKARNFGSKPLKYIRENSNDIITEPQNLPKRYTYRIKSRRNSMLKTKIEIDKDDVISLMEQYKINNGANKTQIIDDKILPKGENFKLSMNGNKINKNKNIVILSSNWFHDVKVSNLPIDILSNNHFQKQEKNPKIINKKIGLNSKRSRSQSPQSVYFNNKIDDKRHISKRSRSESPK